MPGNLVAARPVGAVVHRHRHHRHQGGLRQFLAVEQVLAQHAGHQCHHHVVDLDPEVVLDGLDVLEIQLGEGDVAVRGDAGVERRLGAANGAAIARPPAGTRLTVSTTVATVAGSTLVARLIGRVANRPSPPRAMRSGLASPLASTGSGGGGVGLEAAQLRHQVGAGHAVDGGVVNLGHHRQPAALARRRCRRVPRSPTSPTAGGGGPAAAMPGVRRSRPVPRGRPAPAGRCGARGGRGRIPRPPPTPGGRD